MENISGSESIYLYIHIYREEQQPPLAPMWKEKRPICQLLACVVHQSVRERLKSHHEVSNFHEIAFSQL